MPGGRPSKYDPIYITKVDEYLAQCEDEERDYAKTVGDKSNSFERLITVKLPTIEGFALFIGVNKTTLYEWEQVEQEFSNALDKIKTIQKQRLLEKGLSGDYNPVIAKLVLSANHGMREKSDITTDGEKITVNVVKYDGDRTS